MTLQPVRHGQTIIFPASLDPDAVSVVKRLVDAGFESYLVGGCVRDLLCGRIPKDFDVSTAARPRQIRSRFRNCRVIGRRFKLAHVHFGDKIIEVATFRRTPDARSSDDDSDAEDLLITRDNVYGSAEEDVVRRDFTINALLYDVNTDEVVDYVGGVTDLNDRVLRTIGDPAVRLGEDPVRMLRAIRFTSRLHLTLEAGLQQALGEAAPLIAKSSPPRVIEEVYRLLTCGGVERALPALIDYDLLRHLLPEIADFWREHRDDVPALGAALDLVDHGTRRVDNAFLLATLFLAPWQARVESGQDPMQAGNELLGPAALRMNISRRDVATVKQLLLMYRRLERNRRPRRVRLDEFLARPATQQALELLHVSCRAGRADPEMHAQWTRRLAEGGVELASPSSGRPKPEHGGTRKRSRRRGGRGRRRKSAAPRQDTVPPSEVAATPPPSPPPDDERIDRHEAVPAPASPASAVTPTARTDRSDAPPPAPPGGLLDRMRSKLSRLLGREAPSSSAPPPPAPRVPAPPAHTEPACEDAASTAGNVTSADDGETRGTSPPRSARRRRRGRRGRGSSRRKPESTSEGDDRADRPQDEGAEAQAPRPPRRRKRGGKGGQGGKGRQGGQGSKRGGTRSGARSGSGKTPDKPGASQRGGRKRTRKAGKGDESETDRSAPAHQHPEDIEDLFDW